MKQTLIKLRQFQYQTIPVSRPQIDLNKIFCLGYDMFEQCGPISSILLNLRPIPGDNKANDIVIVDYIDSTWKNKDNHHG